MDMRRTLSVVAVAVSFGASCILTDAHDTSIEVAGSNDLGVATLQIEHSHHQDRDVFLLRGLSADKQVRASVQLTIGAITDLAAVVPGEGNIGSEIVVSARGDEKRVVSRETQLFHLSVAAFPQAASFLALPEVVSALDREAHIVTEAPPAAGEVAERPLWEGNCNTGSLNTTPTAKECCISIYGPAGQDDVIWTSFQRALDGAGILRYQNVCAIYNRCSSNACKASDGVTSCSGSACYYGPSGFARPSVFTGTNNHTNLYTYADGQVVCFPTYSTPKSPAFPNMTGTNSTLLGCCINGSGPCGGGSFPACTACGGGGAAGRGLWDY